MTDFRDVTSRRRFEQGFTDGEGNLRCVWGDYSVQDGTRVILHVEADEELRGTGAASQFMQNLADHARTEQLTLVPRCAYAVAWFKRHPNHEDVLE